jgi:hypothetical protein
LLQNADNYIVAQFRYLGMIITNQNLIQEEIKRRLNSGNACYQSVQNLLSSRLLSKNIKIRIYKTIFFFIIGGVGLSPSTAATSGLLYKPQMMRMIVEQLVE